MSVPKVLLGDVVEILSGFAFKSELFSDSDGMPLIRIRDVVRGYSDTRYSGTYSDQFVVQNGEIIIGMDGNFNAARWGGGPALLNQRVCKISAKAGKLDDGYLFHFLPSVLKKIEDATPFVTVKHLSAVDLKAETIPLPPIPEQRRIAAILDQADALRSKRREALAQLDMLTQSIFIEMFGDPVANPMGWQVVRLGSHTVKMGSGSTPTGGDAAYKESGISLIRSLNVHDGEFIYKNLAHIDEQQAAKLANVNVEANDVLLNITGASVARVCRAPSDVLPARVNQHVMIIRPKETLNSSFLERLLLTPQIKRRLLQIGGAGATREAITKAQAEELRVIYPPIDIQLEFERRFSSLTTTEERMYQSLDTLNGLFSSLQHRAFRGEL